MTWGHQRIQCTRCSRVCCRLLRRGVSHQASMCFLCPKICDATPYFVKEGPRVAVSGVWYMVSGILYVSVIFNLGFGIGGLLVWGIECVPEIEWHSNKAFFVSLGVGVRYTNCPAYQNYGDISKLIDLPIKIGVGFYLNNKKRQQ